MKYLLTTIFIILTIGIKAKTFEEIISLIKQNNTEIKSLEKLKDGLSLEAKTNILPSDPEVGYGYFPGNSHTSGSKTVYSIGMSFNFPTWYFHSAKMSKIKQQHINLTIKNKYRQILEYAGEKLIDYYYYSQKHKQLKERKEEIKKLNKGINKKYETGDANILEVNKSDILLAETRNELNQTKAYIKSLYEELKQLNGNLELPFFSLEYIEKSFPNWNDIYIAINSSLPSIQLLDYNNKIAKKNVQLSRANNLPKITLSLENESVAEESFTGLKGGISIPLWENKNKIKAAKAMVWAVELENKTTKEKLIARYKSLYTKTEALYNSYTSFSKKIQAQKSTILLTKAYEAGELSSIEYFIELGYYYEISDKLIDMEREYLLSKNKLFSYMY